MVARLYQRATEAARALAVTFVLATLSFSSLAAPEDITTYQIDPGRTRVTLKWSYLGFPVTGGRFSNVSGFIYGNKTEPEQSWAEAIIPVRTFKSSMAAIDYTLVESGDFFRPDEFPAIKYRSFAVSTVDKVKREFSLTGQLTVNGVTKPLMLYAEAPEGEAALFGNAKGEVFLKAQARFRRSEFGMGSMQAIVSDEIIVLLDVVAVKK